MAATATDDLRTNAKSWQCNAGQPLAEFKLQHDLKLTLRGAQGEIASWHLPVRIGQIADALQVLSQQWLQRQQTKPFKLADGRTVLPDRSVLQLADQIITLTEKECQTLVYLAQAGRAVPRDELLEAVWRYQPDVQSHTVETLIWRLRQKLEVQPEQPKILLTIPDGYQLQLAAD